MIITPTAEKRHRLFECTTKPLDAFVRPNHRLRQIDARLDFGKLTAPLLRFYEPDHGRPAVHPEILVRALLLGHLYAITSFRRLCDEINENLAFRWFCYLGLEDEVFDHSTISVFLERVGPEGFKLLLATLNHELASAGVLASEAYADSSLVPANTSSEGLSFSTLSPEEFAARAIEDNGLFVTTEVAPRDRRHPKVRRVIRHYFQDRKGRLELNRSDLDARWRTQSYGKKARLSYKQHVIVDRRGFILAQEITRASEVEAEPALALLTDLSIPIRSLAADTGYSRGKLRRALGQRHIQAFIPMHPRQLSYRIHNEGFITAITGFALKAKS